MVHQYFLKLGTLLKALKVYRLGFFSHFCCHLFWRYKAKLFFNAF
jgi:hypothetical protein